MTLQVGDVAPPFTLPDASGQLVSLADFAGQRVVVYFYPKDDTPGCTKEAASFRDAWSVFEKNRIKVLGISKDPASSHTKFIEKYQLPFTLLTDLEPCPVAKAYGSYGTKQFMGRDITGMLRHTFLIDSGGRVEKAYTQVKAEAMAGQILRDLGLS